MKRTPESHFQFDEEDNDDFLAEVAAVEAHLLSHSKRFKSSAAPAANTSSAIATLNYSKGSNQEPQGAYLAALRGNVTPRHLMEQQRKNSTSVPSRVVANGSRLKVVTADAGAGGDQSGSGADDACFKCGKSGHWARDCDSARVGDRLSESSVPEKACPCGEGICSVLTANTERNKGRRFYRCPVRQEMGGCTFFEWCDSSSGVTMANTNYSKNVNTFPDLACPCGAGSCLILTAKTGNNAGQQFYRCPANQGNSCGFFKWCNEQIATGGLSVSAKQAYSSASGGSSFNGTNSSYGGKGGSSCFKCGKEGHWARDCSAPSEPSSGYTMKPNSSSGTCYKCGKPGHWAKECPNH